MPDPDDPILSSPVASPIWRHGQQGVVGLSVSYGHDQYKILGSRYGLNSSGYYIGDAEMTGGPFSLRNNFGWGGGTRGYAVSGGENIQAPYYRVGTSYNVNENFLVHGAYRGALGVRSGQVDLDPETFDFPIINVKSFSLSGVDVTTGSPNDLFFFQKQGEAIQFSLPEHSATLGGQYRFLHDTDLRGREASMSVGLSGDLDIYEGGHTIFVPKAHLTGSLTGKFGTVSGQLTAGYRPDQNSLNPNIAGNLLYTGVDISEDVLDRHLQGFENFEEGLQDVRENGGVYYEESRVIGEPSPSNAQILKDQFRENRAGYLKLGAAVQVESPEVRNTGLRFFGNAHMDIGSQKSAQFSESNDYPGYAGHIYSYEYDQVENSVDWGVEVGVRYDIPTGPQVKCPKW